MSDLIRETEKINYSDLDSQGKFMQLLELSLSNTNIEAKFWEIHALWRLGRIEESLEVGEKYRNQLINNSTWRAKYYNRMGAIYSFKGNLEKTLDYFTLAYNAAEGSNDKHTMAITLNNIGTINMWKGDLDPALDALETAAKQLEEIGNKIDRARCLGNIGKVYEYKRDLNLANKYHLECYEVRQEFNNLQEIGNSLWTLCELELKRNNREKAKSYLDKLEVLTKEEEDSVILGYYEFALALYLKSSKRNRDKSRSELLFVKTISSKSMYSLIILEAIPHLLELLLVEYKLYGESEVMDEIYQYLDKLKQISEENHMYRHLIKSLVIGSQLAEINGELEESEIILEKALSLTIEKNLLNLQKEVQRMKDQMVINFKEMKNLIKTNANFSQKLEKSSIMNYIKQVQGMKFEE